MSLHVLLFSNIVAGGRGDVIFTSRNKWLVGLGRYLEIPPMKSDEGVRLLLRGRGEQDIEQHKVEWSKVVRRLGGLALALDQARAYLRYKNISMEASKNFLATYEAHRNAVLQNMPRDFWESKRTQAQGLEEQNMVIGAFTTWEMLFQEIDSADQQRKNYVHHFLTLSAFFEPSHIGESIFQCRHQPVYTPVEWMNIFSTTPNHIASQDPRSSNTNALEIENPENSMSDNDLANGKTGQCDQDAQYHRKWDHMRFWDLIWQLQNEFCLLQITSNTDTKSCSFSLHPLIRDWIQVREPAEKIQIYTYEAIDFVHASIQARMDAPTPAEQQRLVLTHLDACVWNDNQFTHKEYRLGRHSFNFYIASSFSNFYKHSGRASASLELSSAVMETRKQVLGKEHRHTLIAIEEVASLYVQQARWKEAEELQEGVIAIKEKIFGSEHLETLASRVGLADIYINQMRQKDAENLLLQVLEKRKKKLAQEQVTTTLAMMKLVLVYTSQNNWREATELCSSLIEIQTRVLGAGDQNTLASMQHLASLYVYQGKRKEAEELEVQVRETWNQKRSVPHVDTLESVMKSHSSLVGMGQEEAEELFEQERDATKRIPGAQLSDTERIRNTLLANKKGFMKEAKELLAQELVLKELVINDENSEPLNPTSRGDKITYSALNRDKREIRLLTLCSGGFEDEIRCKLDVVSLDETLTYTALSYCWGNQSEHSEVFVDERKANITKSLEIALRYARQDYQDVVLWVDAICINQENLKEKSYQVGMMGRIYATGKS
jgi:CRISPR/Cas system CSM-associated protein Csm2 small subunit